MKYLTAWKVCVITFWLVLSLSVQAADHFAAPNGTPTGDGSISNPWDLDTALASYDKAGNQLPQRPEIQPGDTIWLRGGIYQSNWSNGFISHISGSTTAPIIVRNYNGEHATVDGLTHAYGLASQGSYVWFWGIEVTNSLPYRNVTTSGSLSPPIASGFYSLGPNNKFINCIAHDTSDGFTSFEASPNNEFYGNLSYYNGWIAPDRNHGHGIYMHADSGNTIVSDNIVGDNADEGMQIYGSASAVISGFRISGNVLYNTSWPNQPHQYNLLMGGGTSHDNVFDTNFSYFDPGSAQGYNAAGIYTHGGDYTITNNIFAGGAIGFAAQGASGPYIFTGNTVFVKDPTPAPSFHNVLTGLWPDQNYSTYTWDHNTYYGLNKFYSGVYDGTNTTGGQDLTFSNWQGKLNGFDLNSTYSSASPTGKWIYVRPNKYEAKRANIIIYNWDLSPTVNVDVSGVLAAGDQFIVMDAQNFFGAPVAHGTYTGGAIALPMTGLLKAAGNGFAAPEHTAPEFATFIIMVPPAGSALSIPLPTPTPEPVDRDHDRDFHDRGHEREHDHGGHDNEREHDHDRDR